MKEKQNNENVVLFFGHKLTLGNELHYCDNTSSALLGTSIKLIKQSAT